jgi:membrane-associated phospholipid phosphatase
LIASEPEPERAEPLSIYDVSLLGDGLIIAATMLGAGVPYALKGRIVDPSCPCDRDEVNALDRKAIGHDSAAMGHLADVTVALALVGPLVADALVLRDRRVWLEDAVVFMEAITTNLALVGAVKLIVQRPEPRLYEPASAEMLTRERHYLSFYSGHTSTAFTAMSAAVVTVGWRYGRWALPCLAAGALGASVGAEVVLAGWHFPTDVMAGAAAGVIVGTLVPWLHLRGSSVRVLPWTGASTAGLVLRGRL